MHVAYHHYLKHKHEKKMSRKPMERFVDSLVYFSTAFGVAANIPQFMEIWVNKKVEGVSLVTWAGFCLGSLFWLLYGVIHREKPIIIANSLFVTVQFLIVAGLVIQGVPIIFF